MARHHSWIRITCLKYTHSSSKQRNHRTATSSQLRSHSGNMTEFSFQYNKHYYATSFLDNLENTSERFRHDLFISSTENVYSAITEDFFPYISTFLCINTDLSLIHTPPHLLFSSPCKYRASCRCLPSVQSPAPTSDFAKVFRRVARYKLAEMSLIVTARNFRQNIELKILVCFRPR